ncbi:hypothetical protein NC651_029403 [Populus alba x Populus x berolinensis]|nr:hypothetical protein NC651_029403 [Populus alba x Populus x berolinensis]
MELWLRRVINMSNVQSDSTSARETDTDRDKMLLELEQECLEVYRRKVDQANRNRAQLRQAIADSEAELAVICSSMGERPVHIRQADQNAGSLKEELGRILPQLEEMRKRKLDRRKQFHEVVEDIQKISSEIYGSADHNILVDEDDLSLRRLEELHRQLHELDKEKLQDLATTMLELWNLMDTPVEEQQEFQNVTCNIAASEHEITEPNTLSLDFIKYVEAEVSRLEELKSSKDEGASSEEEACSSSYYNKLPFPYGGRYGGRHWLQKPWHGKRREDQKKLLGTTDS